MHIWFRGTLKKKSSAKGRAIEFKESTLTTTGASEERMVGWRATHDTHGPSSSDERESESGRPMVRTFKRIECEREEEGDEEEEERRNYTEVKKEPSLNLN